jgi:hypothetical protein
LQAADALGRIAAYMKCNAKISFTSFETACGQFTSAKCERDKRVACACALLRTCLTHVFTNDEVNMKR